jgi:hypothetical protein
MACVAQRWRSATAAYGERQWSPTKLGPTADAQARVRGLIRPAGRVAANGGREALSIHQLISHRPLTIRTEPSITKPTSRNADHGPELHKHHWKP